MHDTVRSRFVPQPEQDTETSGRLTLRDGSTAQIRPAAPDDREALVRFFRDLSAESRYRSDRRRASGSGRSGDVR